MFFLEVLAGEPWVWWQKEIFSADTMGCQWGQTIIFDVMFYTHLLRELKEACIFKASSWMSFTSRIISSSCHQFGVSTDCPLYSIHFSYSSAGCSAEKWPSVSSLHLPTGPWKNLSILDPSSGGGPRSNSISSSSHCGGLCAGGGLDCSLVGPCSAICSDPGTSSSISLNFRKGHRCQGSPR